MFNIRRASAADLPAITEIYNYAISNLTATFDTEPKTLSEQSKWLEEHDERHPVLVVEEDDKILGWASLSRWSDRCAYAATAEASVYIANGQQNKGIGRKLLKALLDEGQKAGLHTVIARITEGNAASIHLCESLGFLHIGTMKEVGAKFGKLLDVSLMQKIYT